MQIDRFVYGEDLKEELESMEGYEERNWKQLKRSMQELWGDLFPKIKHTIQDLKDLSEEHQKKGGIKNIQEYKVFLSKFLVITK